MSRLSRILLSIGLSAALLLLPPCCCAAAPAAASPAGSSNSPAHACCQSETAPACCSSHAETGDHADHAHCPPGNCATCPTCGAQQVDFTLQLASVTVDAPQWDGLAAALSVDTSIVPPVGQAAEFRLPAVCLASQSGDARCILFCTWLK